MTEQTVQIRVKTESTEFEDHAGSRHPVQVKTPSWPGTTSITQVKTEAAGVYIPSQENLVEIPPEKCKHLLFPPGCPVLYTNTREDPIIVFQGEVERVWIELTPEGGRDLFYTVTRRREPSVIAAESQLQWAPGCRVLVKLPSLPGQEWTRAVVIGSYQERAGAAALYSVQLVEPATGLFHGIRKDCMSYRIRSLDPPSAHSKNDNDRNDGQTSSPTNAETDETSSRSSPKPPPNVNAISSSDLASTSSVQPVLPPEVPGMANEEIDNTVSDTSISPRKRPLWLEQANTESEVADDLSMGCCYAELKIPSWMGLNDSFVELLCVADRNVNKCRFCVLERPLKMRNDPNASLPPEQSIFLYGRDKDAVDQARNLVTNLLHEYVGDEVRAKLRQVLKYDGWMTTLVGNDEPGDTQQDSFSASCRSMDKKVKVTPEAENKTDSTKDVAVTPQMLRQSPSGSVSKDTRDRIETTASAPSGSLQLLTSPTNTSSEYDKHETRRCNRDDIWEDESTLMISIPKFADPVAIKRVLLGENNRNLNALVRETGCNIRVFHLNSDQRGKDRKQIEVEVTGHSLRRAQEILEDKILSTVHREEWGRMLYYLAKDNNYGSGSSDGVARYQRSPEDPENWVWMAVVGLPSGFDKYAFLFIGKGGSGITQIKKHTDCTSISVVHSQPPYIFLSDVKRDAVNQAVEAAKERVHFATQIYRSSKRQE